MSSGNCIGIYAHKRLPELVIAIDTRINLWQNTLIGVSTPAFHEKLLRKMSRIRVNPDRKVLAMERKSFEYLERRITSGETLVLELDESGESIVDGMMWAYVWNRGEMMNVGIIRDGYAYSKTMSPNVKHAVLLNILSGNARNKREAVLNGKAS